MITEFSVKMALVSKVQTIILECLTKNNFMILFAINLSVTILEPLEYGELSPIWNKFIEIYLHFCKHENARIRNGAVYGLNLIVKKSPPGVLKQEEISFILHSISNSYTDAFEEESDSFYIKRHRRFLKVLYDLILMHHIRKSVFRNVGRQIYFVKFGQVFNL